MVVQKKIEVTMDKLKGVYSECYNIPVESMRFLFDGTCINDDETVEHDDIIQF